MRDNPPLSPSRTTGLIAAQYTEPLSLLPPSPWLWTARNNFPSQNAPRGTQKMTPGCSWSPYVWKGDHRAVPSTTAQIPSPYSISVSSVSTSKAASIRICPAPGRYTTPEKTALSRPSQVEDRTQTQKGRDMYRHPIKQCNDFGPSCTVRCAGPHVHVPSGFSSTHAHVG